MTGVFVPGALVPGALVPGGPAPATPVMGAIGATPDLLAIKARRVLVGDGTEIEHAVILVDGGKIVTIGQDLPIERGIPVLELDDDQLVMPGLVNPYSRFGMTGGGYNDSRAQVKASTELYPPSGYRAALEAGVTTLGLYPAGTGIPGQAVVVRPMGGTSEEMIVKDGAYLKVVMRPSSSNKRNLKKGFEAVEKYRDKVEKEREKWEKKNKPSSKSSSDKKGDDAADEKKEESKSSSSKKKESPFVPPAPDEETAPWLAVVEKKLPLLVTIDSAAAYDHFIDALGKEDVDWSLRIGLSREIDVFYVKEKIGKQGCYVLIDPEITLHPGTMRQRNLPAEFDRAGAKVVLLPRSDSASGFESWLEDVGVLIGAGLDRKAAVRGVTQYAADFLGLGAELGTLAEGKRANLLILSGDPFEPGTEVDAVMLDGQIVHGETRL
ncbi:MAG: amidohydrolase family protein [Planctomycetota bacterium]